MARRQLQETLLGVCTLRAAHVYGNELIERGRPADAPATRRETIHGVWRSTIVGSKVCALIVLWAIALNELDVDELRVEQFVEWSTDSRATVHRRLHEFRELFPEHETPNELARLVADEARRRRESPSPHVAIAIPAVA
jgi:hypothetical protein